MTKSKEEFVKIMDNLGLAYPKQIGMKPLLDNAIVSTVISDKSLPANLVCGVYEAMDTKLREQVEKDVAAYGH